MKKILLLMVAVVISLSASAKTENDTTVCFTISPAMSCVNCENKIKTNLRFEKGISAIEATAPGDKVTIKYNKKKTDAAKIAAAFGKIGYKAAPASASGKAHKCEKKEAACDGKSKTCCKKGGCDNKTDGKECCKSKQEKK